MARIGKWLGQWGFATLVGAATAVGAFVAWKVAVLDPAPNFALKAAAIYRIEVGAAAFLGFYLVSIAFVLAMNNRGFSEIGMSGMKAQDLANRGQQRALAEHENALESVGTMVTELEEFTESSVEELNTRLAEIENKSAGEAEK